MVETEMDDAEKIFGKPIQAKMTAIPQERNQDKEWAQHMSAHQNGGLLLLPPHP